MPPKTEVSKSLTRISRAYDATFYSKHILWEADYECIASVIGARLQFKSVLDVGCGNGYILEHLRRQGKAIAGIEGSAVAFRFLPSGVLPVVALHDLVQPICLGYFDLVICTEVAEHLPPDAAATLIETITNHTPRVIVFSAAPPGQRGHHHYNEQEASYWIQLFNVRGYSLAPDETSSIKAALIPQLQYVKWIASNLVVLKNS